MPMSFFMLRFAEHGKATRAAMATTSAFAKSKEEKEACFFTSFNVRCKGRASTRRMEMGHAFVC